MRRLVIVLVLACMLFSPWYSVAGSFDKGDDGAPAIDTGAMVDLTDMPLESRAHLVFGEVTMEEVDGYSMLHLDGATGNYMQPGAPVLPTYGHMSSFPVGTKVRSVTIEKPVHYKVVMDDKVVPAPQPIPLTFGSVPIPLAEGEVYGQDALFPATELTYRVTTGSSRWGGVEAHVFVTVFPLRYNPVTGELDLLEEADVVISYDLPDRDLLPATRESYQILAITPQDLYNETLRYKQHKEGLGWTVKVVSLDNVYDNSIFNTSTGRDNPERIKMFVYDAVLNWSVEHLLIVGDSEKFPVRICRIEDGADGTSTPSDFYFGDVFKKGSTNFSDWNSDNDGYWCESRSSAKNADNADLDPDVTVGRYPASTVTELEKMINKTISYYENVSTPEGKEWFRNVSFNGADTFGGSSGGVYEGEFALNTAAQYMTEFNITKFYQSTGTFIKADIESFLNKGAGFASWSDHGSTGGVVWTSGGYGPGLSSTVADRLTNGHKLFLSIQDACSTNRFDGMDGLGEHIVLNPDGAGIGAIGMTRIGWGMWDQWHVQGLSGYMGVHIIEKYSDGVIMPGAMMDEAKRGYLTDWGMNWVSDMKTLAGYALLGDPTTFIGGPDIDFETNETEVWAAPGDVVDFEITVRNSEFHDDELNISILGGSWAWGHDLNRSRVPVLSNDTVNITLSVTVDDHSLAYSSDSVTLSVETLSVPFPIEQRFTVHVIEVRSVSIGVNETDFTVLPGEDVTVDYSIANNGNIFENASAWLHGDHGDWEVNQTQENITIDAFSSFFGNLSFAVPEMAEAGKYHFELRIETVNGCLRSFFITVTVSRTYGLEAYALEDQGEVEYRPGGGPYDVEFPVFIENLGNHLDEVECAMDLVDRPSGPSSDWSVDYGLPSAIVLPPFSNITEGFGVELGGSVLAGDYTFLLSVNLGSDDMYSKNMMLNISVSKGSLIDLEATQAEISVDQGGSAEFSLSIDSMSNFEESVTLDVTGLPVGWSWTPSISDIVVPAFSDSPFDVTFEVPDKTLAGSYAVEVVATGEDSNDSIVLTVVVKEDRGLELAIDRDKETVFVGEGTSFELTMSNPGNIDDQYIIRTTKRSGLVVWFDEDFVELDAWSEERVVKFTVDVKQGTPEGRYEVEVEAASISDGDVKETVMATITAKVKFVPSPDLNVLGGGRSNLYPGDQGQFEIMLMNNGNIEELVTLELSLGPSWTITMPANLTIDPGTEESVNVIFHVPSEERPAILTIEVHIGSESVNTTVVHTVEVLEVPDKGTTPLGDTSDMLPIFLIIIIVVLIIALVAALLRRSKEATVQPPPPTSAAYEGATTAPPPEEPRPDHEDRNEEDKEGDEEGGKTDGEHGDDREGPSEDGPKEDGDEVKGEGGEGPPDNEVKGADDKEETPVSEGEKKAGPDKDVDPLDEILGGS